MKTSSVIITAVVALVLIVALVGLTLVLTPENTNPAFAAATRFMNAAGNGDDETAFELLSSELQTYVTENCPDGSVSACIDAYTPPQWGDLLSAVYRRSIPDNGAWDVLLVATYEEDQGFSGVCIYHRVEEVAPDDWRVAAWSGFVSCDRSDAGIQGLRRTDAPNRVP